ncbi:MAG: dihydrofolate reductase [Roseiarcus sp.]
MPSPYRIAAYAIVSSDGMIADVGAVMPDALMNKADKAFFERELDQVDAVAHGRHSHEHQPNSARRRRLVMTRKVAGIAPDPDLPHALFWNPAGASFNEACRALGLEAGTVAVLGGTEAFDLFLDIGYDVFYLTRADKVKLPGGVPVFSQVRGDRSPEDVLAQHGYEPEPKRMLDEANAVSVVGWTRNGRA